MKKTTLALFDFDGTMTRKDSFVDFLLFSLGKAKFYWSFTKISPLILLYLFGIFPNWRMKEAVLNLYFVGEDFHEFKEICRKYGQEKLPSLIREQAHKRINWHLEKGHKVAIVTATIEYYLTEWCHEQNIKLIATKMQTKNNKITGKIDGKICHGVEKVRRIKEEYNLADYKNIYAYGNSRGDLPMLDLAKIKYFNWKKI